MKSYSLLIILLFIFSACEESTTPEVTQDLNDKFVNTTKYHFGEENAYREIASIKAKYFNTKSRLLEWAKTMDYRHGSIKQIEDEDEQDYIQACN